MPRYARYRETAYSYWVLNRLVVRAGARTVAHRVRRQRRQASWSLGFEGVVEMMTLGTPSANIVAASQIREPLDRVTLIGRALPLVSEPVTFGSWQAEWLAMPNARPERVILYLHGGGYVSGSSSSHRAVIGYLAHHAAARAFALNYRLAPEYPFPAALEDAWSAYWWLLCQGIAPQQIFLAGDSAGGGLAVALLLALRDAGMPMPAGAAGLSPWFDLALTGATLDKNRTTDYLNGAVLATAAQMYLGEHDCRDPLASPLYADLHGLPPLLIQVGDAEMLLDDSRRFVQRVRAAGGDIELEVWPGMVHVWHFTYQIEPQARRAVESAGRFMLRCWGDTHVRQEPPPGLFIRPRSRTGNDARRAA